MESATGIELDGQYRALREGAGVLARDAQAGAGVGGAEAAEYLQGQLTNEVEALEPGEGVLRRAARPQGPHAGRHARAAHRRTGFSIDTEALAGDAVVRHLSTYKIGRDVTIEEVTEQRAILSVIGPAASEIVLGRPARAARARAIARRRSAVSTASSSPPTSASTCSSPRPKPAAVREALLAAGAEPVGERGRGDRAGGGRPAALRPRDDHRDDPSGGGHQRARGELHQGLLHRPGDGRPPALPGQAEPPASAACGSRRPRRPETRSGSGTRARPGRAPRSSPPPSVRSRSRSSVARPSPAPRWRSAMRSRPRSSSCRSERAGPALGCRAFG